ncbi:MAG TPA: beta-propeller fold lactonase family protein [Streptosporangiaceae bacterium]|jgi:6-phosphogluconolactonase (cycloisomerase 2 family)
MTRLLIGGYSGGKGNGTGISVLEDGRVTTAVLADSPSWIARHPFLPVLYAVAETDEGHVHAWALKDGAPAESLGSGATGGAEPAHLTVDPSGRFLMTANYSGGSISVHRLGPDGGIGVRTDLVQHERHGDMPRQEAAHPHMVRALPAAPPQPDDATASVLVVDLGGDAIYRYQLTDEGKLRPDGIISSPPGAGPRHVLAAGGRFFVTAELSGQVLVYDAAGAPLGALPASRSDGPNQPSELAASDRFLYVANRGPNTVAVFELTEDEELPRFVTEVATGDWPRHIALDKGLLYVANERSHEVMTMRIDPVTGIPALAETTEVPSPTMVLP